MVMPGHPKRTYPDHTHMTLDVRQIVADPAKPKGQGQGARGRSKSPGPSRNVKGDLDVWVL